MKSKTKIGAIVIMVSLLVSQVAYGSEMNKPKKEQLKEILTQAEAKGAVIDIEFENIDYENLNIAGIEASLLALTSMPQEIILEPVDTDPVNVDKNNSNIMPAAYDEYVKYQYAQYKYNGSKDIYGRSYNYNTIIHFDYDCLFDRNGRAQAIDRINDTFATGINMSFGVSFSQTGSIISTMSSDYKSVKLRGKGRYTVGLEGLGGAYYDVEYSCTARAGDNGPQY